MFRYSWTEDHLCHVQKALKILTVQQENKTQPRHDDKNWPAKGGIVADNVRLRYRKDTPMILKGLNLNIKGGEKVGIVGRTGAGKSTLANALTRMTEICKADDREYDEKAWGKDKKGNPINPLGSIKFDGVNISEMSM